MRGNGEEKVNTHTRTHTKVSTQRGLSIYLITEAGGFCAWEGAASCSSPTLFVPTSEH